MNDALNILFTILRKGQPHLIVSLISAKICALARGKTLQADRSLMRLTYQTEKIQQFSPEENLKNCK